MEKFYGLTQSNYADNVGCARFFFVRRAGPAGQQTTLPIWMLQELIRPRQRPVTNVVAVVIVALTFVPILLAYLLTRSDEPAHR